MSFWTGVKKGMGLFGATITTLINTLLLSIVYIVGVGLPAILARITGKKFITLSQDYKKSYWVKRDVGSQDMDKYYRQF